MQEEFHGIEKVRSSKLQTLRRELENLSMQDYETELGYYSRIKEIVNKFRVYGENIRDKKLWRKF